MESADIAQKLSKLRVLVVDDTPTNVEILRDQLQNWGMEFEATESATGALTAIRSATHAQRPFQLVILDRHLPDGDGLDLATTIKNDPLMREIPLLMLTSLDTSLDALTLKSTGLAGILTKPIRQSRLLDSILMAVYGQQSCSAVVAANSKPRSAESDRSQISIRLLVADDNEINRMVVGEMLATGGYTFDLVCDGREAIEALQSRAYDLILMDCQMPEMDGFEATQEIRRLESAREIRHPNYVPVIVVALTANAIQGDREKCLAVGMDDYITKPIDRTKLLAIIEAHASRRNTLNADQKSPLSDLTVVDIDEPLDESSLLQLDIRSLLERCSGDKRFAAKMLGKLRQRLPAELEQVRSAISTENYDAVGRLAHSLGGAAATMSAVNVQQTAKELEDAIRNRISATADRTALQLADHVDKLMIEIDQLLTEWNRG